MLNTPFSPWPSFTEEETNAVHRVVLSNKVNYWTGTECREFEKEFAAWVGTSYAVALANGTLALDVVLKVLGIGPGDEVVVTPRTFIASVSCIVNAGSVPLFANIEPDSGNISARTISEDNETQPSLRGGETDAAIQSCSCQHAYYKFYAYVCPENLATGWSRDRIVAEINARGVPCYVGSCSEVYLEKAFDNTGWRPAERLPVAKELGETSLMFLVHPTLTQAEIRKTQDVVSVVLGEAGGKTSSRGAP